MDILDGQPALLAAAIFFARVVDVSIGTLRSILIIRGYRLLGATLGFFEILIWVAAAAQVIQNLDTWVYAVAYAGGFATGNYVGSWLEGRLALGAEIVRAISPTPQVDLARRLQGEGFEVVQIPGQGPAGGPIEVLLVVESRRRVPRLLQAIRDADPRAVCTVSDVRVPEVPRVPVRTSPFGFGWGRVSKRK